MIWRSGSWQSAGSGLLWARVSVLPREPKNKIEYRSRLDLTSSSIRSPVPLLLNFDLPSVSNCFHFEFTPVSFQVPFKLAPISLRLPFHFHFVSISFRLSFSLIVMAFRSSFRFTPTALRPSSLRCNFRFELMHSEFTSILHRYLCDVASISRLCHFDLTSMLLWRHFYFVK